MEKNVWNYTGQDDRNSRKIYVFLQDKEEAVSFLFCYKNVILYNINIFY